MWRSISSSLPPLEPETYAGLKANIAINGVQVPIVR